MTKEEIASLSLKILGIYCFIQAVPLLEHIILPFGPRAGSWKHLCSKFLFLIASFLPICLLLGLACGLFFGSDGLATHLTGKPKCQKAKNSISISDVQSITFSAIGVFVVVLAVPKLLQIAVNAYGSYKFDKFQSIGRLLLYTIPLLVALVTQIALGAWLFFGSTGLAKFWRKMNGEKK